MNPIAKHSIAFLTGLTLPAIFKYKYQIQHNLNLNNPSNQQQSQSQPQGYEQIDYQSENKFMKYSIMNRIDGLEVYRSKDNGQFRISFEARTDLQGHQGIVHGGVTMALVEDIVNNLVIKQQSAGLSQNVKVQKQKSQFKRPIYCNKQYLIEINRNSEKVKAEIKGDDEKVVFVMDLVIN